MYNHSPNFSYLSRFARESNFYSKYASNGFHDVGHIVAYFSQNCQLFLPGTLESELGVIHYCVVQKRSKTGTVQVMVAFFKHGSTCYQYLPSLTVIILQIICRFENLVLHTGIYLQSLSCTNYTADVQKKMNGNDITPVQQMLASGSGAMITSLFSKNRSLINAIK